MPGNRNANPQRRTGNNPNRNGRRGPEIPSLPVCPGGLRHERMRAISAPYNFVPLADWVHIPDWSRKASHDWPFKDGCSGEIRYRLITESWLLVGGNQEENTANDRPNTEVRPFQRPDGRYGIPGSSLKGLIRAVVEIAGFGRMRMVDDRRLSVRDLTEGANEIYGKYMTNDLGDKTYEALTQAGWLKIGKDGSAQIKPCKYARVDHSELENFSRDQWWHQVPRTPEASKKYKRWKPLPLEIQFDLDDQIDHKHSCGTLRYRKAVNLGHGRIDGTLVFTGQPSERAWNKEKNKYLPRRKHMEFIFYGEQEESREVPPEVWRAFREIYAENDDWNKYWKKKKRVPVFYLEENGKIASFGLSLMYRLPYRHSIHQAIAHSSPCHLEEPGLENGYDLADLLFGSTHSEDPNAALRGRVSFETAVALDNPQTVQAPPTILNSPKPSYYPNYIRQKTHPDRPWVLKGEHYNTLMDEKPEIRGYKRYPARPESWVGVQDLTESQKVKNNAPRETKKYKVQIQLHPLRPGTAFEGRILFHNLKREELGALLWALTWGGNKGLRHGLGMGKPFGFGQVRFKIDAPKSYLLPNDADREETLSQEKQQAFMDAFEHHMEAAVREHGGWKNSPQIRNLLAMADPASVTQLPRGMELRHMCLDGKTNEFVWARQRPKDKKTKRLLRKELFVLADYISSLESKGARLKVPSTQGGSGTPTDREQHPELHPWVEQKIAEFAKTHHAKREDVLRGKALAQAWSEIDDDETTQAVLESIRGYWQANGWWDNPKGKAQKQARAIYGGKTS